MKKHNTLIIMLFTTMAVQAQTPQLKEFVRQKKMQRKYFAEQLVALQAYKEVLEKGYSIANKGLSLIGEHDGETLAMNRNYLSSLTSPKLGLTKDQNPEGFLVTHVFIIKAFQSLVTECDKSEDFTPQEKKYIHNVNANVTTKCGQTLAMVDAVNSSESTTMTDQERNDRLRVLSAEMNDHKNFTIAFCASTRSLGAQRAKERREQSMTRQLNNLKP